MSIQIVTAGRYNQRTWTKKVGRKILSGPIFGVKVYEATVRKTDGAMVWRLVRVLDTTYSVETTAEKAAQRYAEGQKLPFAFGILHGEKLTQVFS